MWSPYWVYLCTQVLSHTRYTNNQIFSPSNRRNLWQTTAVMIRYIFMGSVTSITDFKAPLLMQETEAVYETMTLLFCKFGVKGVHKALSCKGSRSYCLTQLLFDCTVCDNKTTNQMAWVHVSVFYTFLNY